MPDKAKIGVPNIFPCFRYESARGDRMAEQCLRLREAVRGAGREQHSRARAARFGPGMIMMSSGGKPDPKNPATERFGTYVVVPDIEAHYARAKAAAQIERPLAETEYGSREYSARDCGGHLWSFGTYDPYAES